MYVSSLSHSLLLIVSMHVSKPNWVTTTACMVNIANQLNAEFIQRLGGYIVAEDFVPFWCLNDSTFSPILLEFRLSGEMHFTLVF